MLSTIIQKSQEKQMPPRKGALIDVDEFAYAGTMHPSIGQTETHCCVSK